MADKVVILGGGVAGMSAAHELLERGFEVEVYEKLPLPGGKARSIPVMEGLGDHGGKDTQARAIARFLDEGGAERPLGQRRPWLPGEHGFRFFPNFYRHVTDTMARIPYGDGNRRRQPRRHHPGADRGLRQARHRAALSLPGERARDRDRPQGLPLRDLAAQRDRLRRHRAFRRLHLARRHLLRGAPLRGIREDRLVGLHRRRGPARGLPEAARHRHHPLAGRGAGDNREHQDHRRHLRAADLRHPVARRRLGPTVERPHQRGLDRALARPPARPRAALPPWRRSHRHRDDRWAGQRRDCDDRRPVPPDHRRLVHRRACRWSAWRR